MYSNNYSLPTCTWSDEETGEGELVIDDYTKPRQKPMKGIKVAGGSCPIYSPRPKRHLGHVERNASSVPCNDQIKADKELYHNVLPRNKWDKQSTHITVKVFNSKPYMDIRKYYTKECKVGGKRMKWLPTRNGICLSLKEFQGVVSCIRVVDEVIAKTTVHLGYDDN